MVLEVADDRVDGDTRVDLGDPLRAAAERLLAHVEGDELAEAVGRDEGVEQEARLLGRAGAELDERLGAAERGDLVGVRLEDRALRPCEVVLGQARDLVEELGAALVVEPLRRQLLRRGGETAARVGAKRRLERAGMEPKVDSDSLGERAPLPHRRHATHSSMGCNRI